MINAKQRGFTLVEMMVASAVALIMLSAMTAVLLKNREIFKTQSNMEKIQNESRFVFEVIGQELRSSGYRGCISGPNTSKFWVNFKNMTLAAPSYIGSIVPIQGYRGQGTSWSPILDNFVRNQIPVPSPKYDVLTVRSTGSKFTLLNSDMTDATSTLTVNDATDFLVGEYSVISNCAASTLFRINGKTATSITAVGGSVGYTYKKGAQVYPLNTVNFYVSNASGEGVLYKQQNNKAPEALIGGVDAFSILYGVSVSSNPNAVAKYVYANSVTDPSTIVSVRLGLVLRGTDNNVTVNSATNNTYKFNGNLVSPSDKRLRKVFYTTINLRNMVP